MGKIYKNRIAARVFVSFIVLFFLNGCVVTKSTSLKSTVKIEGEKERLVAKNIGNGLPFSFIKWCGNVALLIYGDEIGIEWVDLNGNKVTVSTKSTDYPIDCTPDGKWVIYKDRGSARTYKDERGRIPESIVDEGPGWHGFVFDLYRYELATGIRQKFAVVRDDSGALVSPDGSKVLLGNRHDSVVEMPEPGWKKVWLTKEWLYFSTRWFADSSGIVTMIWGNVYSLGVEIFGENGWAKEFDLKQRVCFRKGGCSVTLSAVDREGGFYISTIETVPVDKRRSASKYHFFLCKVENKRLLCDERAELVEHEKRFDFIEALPEGDIIFSRDGDDCIRRFTPEQNGTGCIADTRYGGEAYKIIDAVAVSPNARLLAFLRGKELPKQSGGFYTYQLDLFVTELSGD